MKEARAEPRPGRVLVIEDDRILAETVQLLLTNCGHQVTVANTAQQGMRSALASDFDLVVADLRLPDGNGIEIIRSLKSAHKDAAMILMTSYSSVDNAVQALREGAVDYIIKPFNNDDFLHAIERALDEKRIRRENAALKRKLKTSFSIDNIIGKSDEIKKILNYIRRVAPTSASVLIEGESGTGKELVAQAIHHASPRSYGPFVPLNCGAIPVDLLESELFGHERGAFTGATAASEGLIRQADGGTLFLDEISELAPNLQVKLLRVLQEKQVRPVGGQQVFEADVRFIAASNRDLRRAVEAGTFRDDLFYRLNVVNIYVPPLRNRENDVLLLAQHFVDHYSRKIGKRVRAIGEDLATFLQAYHWPGNVRELENLVERAVIFADSEVLTCDDLPDMMLPIVSKPAPSSEPGKPLSIEEYIKDVVIRCQDSHSETELANILGIGRKALWVRRRRWGLFRDHGGPRALETKGNA
jgi:DNA-binding NtrC family response regulator